MENFLSILFFVVAGFYLLGWIGRMLLRWFILSQARKMEQGGATFRGFTWSSGGSSNHKTEKKEGEVRVERKVQVEKKVNKQVGEYVDYEEVDEQKSDKNDL